MTRQEKFNPIDFGFRWTEPAAGEEFGWYEFGHVAASTAAKKARDDRARQLRKQGRSVRRWTQKNNLMTRGGIGTGRPEISLVVPVYYLEVQQQD